MINKIKDLVHYSEEIKEIRALTKENSDELQNLTKEMHKFREEFHKIKDDLNSMQETQSESTKELNQIMHTVKSTNEDFKKEIYNFTILKRDIQKQIIDKFEEELNRQLIGHCEELTTNARHYNEMQQKIADITQKSAKLAIEIDKLTSIAQNIKQGDFELKKYADRLQQMDSEKLQLLRQIDSLERLVSALRRQSPGMQQNRKPMNQPKF